jgi:LmbE family N-acetylglucosaminyl deacetylase/uncharacterized OsmC-like protein
MTGAEPTTHTTSQLPAWTSVLAVVAHPDDESFGLGAILDSFGRGGSLVSVLCLTHGEASTLGPGGDLGTLRATELQIAAKALGVDSAFLLDHPDGALVDVDAKTLAADVLAAVKETVPDGLLVFDPTGVSGHPDHVAATAAALTAAQCVDLPVLGWTLPRAVAEKLNDEFEIGFVGHEAGDIDLVLPVDREQQRIASLAHSSQAVPAGVLWRRLELLGDEEHLRWLRRKGETAPRVAVRTGRTGGSADVIRVDHRAGDWFGITIRDHMLSVDQPVDAGGEDIGPTPTELFVASLTSCVAFYTRRYLHRHNLDTTGLTVEGSFRLAAKPARVTAIEIKITPGAEVPAERRDGLMAVARHCTVHNSITVPPDITIDLKATTR